MPSPSKRHIALFVLTALAGFSLLHSSVIWRANRADGSTSVFASQRSNGPAGIEVIRSSADSIALFVAATGFAYSGTSISGLDYDQVTLDGASSIDKTGAPDLPVYRVLLAVPDCDNFQIQTTSHGLVQILPDVRVVPCPGTVRSTWGVGAGEIVYDEDESIYSRDQFYPPENVEIIKLGYMRGQRLALVEVRPVRFNPARQELEVTESIEIDIVPVNATSEVHRSAGPMQGIVSGMIANVAVSGGPSTVAGFDAPNMSGTTGQVCRCQGSDWQSAASSAIACGADYLIIVAGELAASDLIDSLAVRRATYNGFNVAIVSMDQIDATPDIEDTPDTLRSLIKAVYDAGTAAHMGDGRLSGTSFSSATPTTPMKRS